MPRLTIEDQSAETTAHQRVGSSNQKPATHPAAPVVPNQPSYGRPAPRYGVHVHATVPRGVADPSVVRRQRVLAGLGHPIVVDGVPGSRTRGAFERLNPTIQQRLRDLDRQRVIDSAVLRGIGQQLANRKATGLAGNALGHRGRHNIQLLAQVGDFLHGAPADSAGVHPAVKKSVENARAYAVGLGILGRGTRGAVGPTLRRDTAAEQVRLDDHAARIRIDAATGMFGYTDDAMLRKLAAHGVHPPGLATLNARDLFWLYDHDGNLGPEGQATPRRFTDRATRNGVPLVDEMGRPIFVPNKAYTEALQGYANRNGQKVRVDGVFDARTADAVKEGARVEQHRLERLSITALRQQLEPSGAWARAVREGRAKMSVAGAFHAAMQGSFQAQVLLGQAAQLASVLEPERLFGERLDQVLAAYSGALGQSSDPGSVNPQATGVFAGTPYGLTRQTPAILRMLYDVPLPYALTNDLHSFTAQVEWMRAAAIKAEFLDAKQAGTSEHDSVVYATHTIRTRKLHPDGSPVMELQPGTRQLQPVYETTSYQDPWDVSYKRDPRAVAKEQESFAGLYTHGVGGFVSGQWSALKTELQDAMWMVSEPAMQVTYGAVEDAMILRDVYLGAGFDDYRRSMGIDSHAGPSQAPWSKDYYAHAQKWVDEQPSWIQMLLTTIFDPFTYMGMGLRAAGSIGRSMTAYSAAMGRSGRYVTQLNRLFTTRMFMDTDDWLIQQAAKSKTFLDEQRPLNHSSQTLTVHEARQDVNEFIGEALSDSGSDPSWDVRYGVGVREQQASKTSRRQWYGVLRNNPVRRQIIDALDRHKTSLFADRAQQQFSAVGQRHFAMEMRAMSPGMMHLLVREEKSYFLTHDVDPRLFDITDGHGIPAELIDAYSKILVQAEEQVKSSMRLIDSELRLKNGFQFTEQVQRGRHSAKARRMFVGPDLNDLPEIRSLYDDIFDRIAARTGDDALEDVLSHTYTDLISSADLLKYEEVAAGRAAAKVRNDLLRQSLREGKEVSEGYINDAQKAASERARREVRAHFLAGGGSEADRTRMIAELTKERDAAAADYRAARALREHEMAMLGEKDRLANVIILSDPGTGPLSEVIGKALDDLGFADRLKVPDLTAEEAAMSDPQRVVRTARKVLQSGNSTAARVKFKRRFLRMGGETEGSGAAVEYLRDVVRKVLEGGRDAIPAEFDPRLFREILLKYIDEDQLHGVTWVETADPTRRLKSGKRDFWRMQRYSRVGKGGVPIEHARLHAPSPDSIFTVSVFLHELGHAMASGSRGIYTGDRDMARLFNELTANLYATRLFRELYGEGLDQELYDALDAYLGNSFAQTYYSTEQRLASDFWDEAKRWMAGGEGTPAGWTPDEVTRILDWIVKMDEHLRAVPKETAAKAPVTPEAPAAIKATSEAAKLAATAVRKGWSKAQPESAIVARAVVGTRELYGAHDLIDGGVAYLAEHTASGQQVGVLAARNEIGFGRSARHWQVVVKFSDGSVVMLPDAFFDTEKAARLYGHRIDQAVRGGHSSFEAHELFKSGRAGDPGEQGALFRRGDPAHPSGEDVTPPYRFSDRLTPTDVRVLEAFRKEIGDDVARLHSYDELIRLRGDRELRGDELAAAHTEAWVDPTKPIAPRWIRGLGGGESHWEGHELPSKGGPSKQHGEFGHGGLWIDPVTRTPVVVGRTLSGGKGLTEAAEPIYLPGGKAGERPDFVPGQKAPTLQDLSRAELEQHAEAGLSEAELDYRAEMAAETPSQLQSRRQAPASQQRQDEPWHIERPPPGEESYPPEGESLSEADYQAMQAMPPTSMHPDEVTSLEIAKQAPLRPQGGPASAEAARLAGAGAHPELTRAMRFISGRSWISESILERGLGVSKDDAKVLFQQLGDHRVLGKKYRSGRTVNLRPGELGKVLGFEGRGAMGEPLAPRPPEEPAARGAIHSPEREQAMAEEEYRAATRADEVDQAALERAQFAAEAPGGVARALRLVASRQNQKITAAMLRKELNITADQARDMLERLQRMGALSERGGPAARAGRLHAPPPRPGQYPAITDADIPGLLGYGPERKARALESAKPTGARREIDPAELHTERAPEPEQQPMTDRERQIEQTKRDIEEAGGSWTPVTAPGRRVADLTPEERGRAPRRVWEGPGAADSDEAGARAAWERDYYSPRAVRARERRGATDPAVQARKNADIRLRRLLWDYEQENLRVGVVPTEDERIVVERNLAEQVENDYQRAVDVIEQRRIRAAEVEAERVQAVERESELHDAGPTGGEPTEQDLAYLAAQESQGPGAEVPGEAEPFELQSPPVPVTPEQTLHAARRRITNDMMARSQRRDAEGRALAAKSLKGPGQEVDVLTIDAGFRRVLARGFAEELGDRRLFVSTANFDSLVRRMERAGLDLRHGGEFARLVSGLPYQSPEVREAFERLRDLETRVLNLHERYLTAEALQPDEWGRVLDWHDLKQLRIMMDEAIDDEARAADALFSMVLEKTDRHTLMQLQAAAQAEYVKLTDVANILRQGPTTANEAAYEAARPWLHEGARPDVAISGSAVPPPYEMRLLALMHRTIATSLKQYIENGASQAAEAATTRRALTVIDRDRNTHLRNIREHTKSMVSAIERRRNLNDRLTQLHDQPLGQEGMWRDNRKTMTVRKGAGKTSSEINYAIHDVDDAHAWALGDPEMELAEQRPRFDITDPANIRDDRYVDESMWAKGTSGTLEYRGTLHEAPTTGPLPAGWRAVNQLSSSELFSLYAGGGVNPAEVVKHGLRKVYISSTTREPRKLVSVPWLERSAAPNSPAVWTTRRVTSAEAARVLPPALMRQLRQDAKATLKAGFGPNFNLAEKLAKENPRHAAAIMRFAHNQTAAIASRTHREAQNAVLRRVQPHAHLKSGMYLQAMAYSNSIVVRGFYNLLAVPVRVWKFALQGLPVGSNVPMMNVFDDLLKRISSGYFDPRLLVLRTAGRPVSAFTDFGAEWMMRFAVEMDRATGTKAFYALGEMFERLSRSSNRFMQVLWESNAVQVPKELKDFGAERMVSVRKVGRTLKDGTPVNRHGLDWKGRWHLAQETNDVRDWYDAFATMSFHIVGELPQQLQARGIYNRVFVRVRKRALQMGYSETEAERIAMKSGMSEAGRILFDPSKMTVFEQNLEPLFPYILYFRQNAGYWTKFIVSHPWIVSSAQRLEQFNSDPLYHDQWVAAEAKFKAGTGPDPGKEGSDPHARYWDVSALVDDTSQMLGLPNPIEYAAGKMGLGKGQYGFVIAPTSLLSLKTMYDLIFSKQNPNLPPERGGLELVNRLISVFDSVGLGINPYLRAGLSAFDLHSVEAWRTIFPETSILDGMSRTWWAKQHPNGLNLERFFLDPLYKQFHSGKSLSTLRREDISYLIGVEMDRMALAGEGADPAEARRRVTGFLGLAAMVQFVGGPYIRRWSKYDPALMQLRMQQKYDYQNVSADHRAVSTIDRERAKGDEAQSRVAQAFPWIELYYRTTDYKQRQQMMQEHPELAAYVQRTNSRAFYLDATNEQAARRVRVRDTILAAQAGVMGRIYAAMKQGQWDSGTREIVYTAMATPEMQDYFARHQTPQRHADDFLKAEFFGYMKKVSDAFHDIPDSDFKAKQAFMLRNPDLEDFWNRTASETKGTQSILNAANAAYRDWYFAVKQAEGWDAAAPILEAHPQMFDLTKSAGKVDRATGQWLPKNMAAITEHAKDYKRMKPQLDGYFNTPKAGRKAYVAAHPEVAAYFKKYGQDRVFRRRHRFGHGHFAATAGAPWAAVRARFWHDFFQLTPDKRLKWLQAQHTIPPEVFAWGPTADSAFTRDAHAFAWGATPRREAYKQIAGLMNLYFQLDPADRPLFLTLNPEIKAYFDAFSTKSLTGDAKTDKLVETFFSLTKSEQAFFVKDHPALEQWFRSRRKTKEERAIGVLLDAYFGLPKGGLRVDYLADHPELQGFFQERKDQADIEQAIMDELAADDPRWKKFEASDQYQQAKSQIVLRRLSLMGPKQMGKGGAKITTSYDRQLRTDTVREDRAPTS